MPLPVELREYLDLFIPEIPQKEPEDDYISQISPFDVLDGMRISTLCIDRRGELITHFKTAGLTKAQRAGVNRLLGEIAKLKLSEERIYDLTVGDIRNMTDEQLRLIGHDWPGPHNSFHPGKNGVRILRALFGTTKKD